jgi:hypothetical protein
MTNPLGINSGVSVERAPEQGDRRADSILAKAYRGSLVIQKDGDRELAGAPVVDYGDEVLIIQPFTLREGNWVVFAKLNIINTAATTAAKISVKCGLQVGTQIDNYEMLDIVGQSMRLASLIVGANLTAQADVRLVYKLSKPKPSADPMTIVNLTIASILLADLMLQRG